MARIAEFNDAIHFFPDTGTVTALVEMSVLGPDDQLKTGRQPISARLEKETTEPQLFPAINRRFSQLFVIGTTPAMCRPKSVQNNLQEALIVAERPKFGSRNRVNLLFLPLEQLDSNLRRRLLEDLTINTVHPAYLDRLHCRVFTSYSDHALEPHDLHL